MPGRKERLGCERNDITTYSSYVNRMGEFDDDDDDDNITLPPPTKTVKLQIHTLMYPYVR
jgi:hypothetical protein